MSTLRHLESRLIYGRNSFLYFPSIKFFFSEMKDRNSDFFFQIKTDPNQAMKQSFVLKQL